MKTVTINGKKYDVNKIPSGLTVEGHLDLGYCTGLQKLPEGLTVEGDLDLRGCNNLKGIPADLVVMDTMYLENNPKIKFIPVTAKINSIDSYREIPILTNTAHLLLED